MSKDIMDEVAKAASKLANQQAPNDSITDDGDLRDEIQNVMGLTAELDDYADDADWVNAQERVDEIQEIVNRIHAYIAGKIK